MKLFQSLSFSLLIHVILAGTLSWVVPRYIGRPTPSRTLIELVDVPEAARLATPNRLDRQIVRSAPAPKELEDPNRSKPARFLSEYDQRVLEELKAQASGLTANRSSDGGAGLKIPGLDSAKSAEPEENQGTRTREKTALKSVVKETRIPDRFKLRALRPHDLAERGPNTSLSGDVPVAGMARKGPKSNPNASKPLALPGFPGVSLEQGLSTVGEALPSDIKFGHFTALNTDRYVYYSFYSRVEEMIRHRWVNYVRAVLYTYQNTNPVTGRETWVTRMEIVLDRQGRFLRGLLQQGSGLRDLDAAPIQAFRDAAQIPNPPVEMVKEDGTIRLEYQFNVNFVPQYLAGPGLSPDF